MEDKGRCLKERFLEAIQEGQLGHIEDRGVIVTLQEFKSYFTDVQSQYNMSFLPAATIEPGRVAISHTKFVFRISKGVYLVHEDALDTEMNKHRADGVQGE